MDIRPLPAQKGRFLNGLGNEHVIKTHFPLKITTCTIFDFKEAFMTVGIVDAPAMNDLPFS